MEKGLSMAGGQCPVQKYWKQLLGYIESGEVDPSWIFSHVLPLEKAAEGYKMFDLKEDNCTKILLRPSTTSTQ
jgi:threonine dehydrogenase-like Zn-dependent dehydrogenase